MFVFCSFILYVHSLISCVRSLVYLVNFSFLSGFLCTGFVFISKNVTKNKKALCRFDNLINNTMQMHEFDIFLTLFLSSFVHAVFGRCVLFGGRAQTDPCTVFVCVRAILVRLWSCGVPLVIAYANLVMVK